MSSVSREAAPAVGARPVFRAATSQAVGSTAHQSAHRMPAAVSSR
ncbi:hypothetical protein ABZW18_21150 [Streptomyces sp. NPDC004647]